MSNIRWRAVRLRTAALLSSAFRPSEKSDENGSEKKVETSADSTTDVTEDASKKKEDLTVDARTKPQNTGGQEPEASRVDAMADDQPSPPESGADEARSTEKAA